MHCDAARRCEQKRLLQMHDPARFPPAMGSHACHPSGWSTNKTVRKKDKQGQTGLQYLDKAVLAKGVETLLHCEGFPGTSLGTGRESPAVR
jgi:hypothetical protein